MSLNCYAFDGARGERLANTFVPVALRYRIVPTAALSQEEFFDCTIQGGSQVEGYNFECECPVCHGPAYRVRRNPLDRVLSWFARRYRYRCASMSCGWEGTLTIASREKATPSQPGGNSTPDR